MKRLHVFYALLLSGVYNMHIDAAAIYKKIKPALARLRGRTNAAQPSQDELNEALMNEISKKYANTDRINELIKEGADVNYLKGEITPLKWALRRSNYRGDGDVVRLLLDKGADPNLANALHYAAMYDLDGAVTQGATYGYSDAPRTGRRASNVILLIEHGANPTLTNNSGKTFIDVAPIGVQEAWEKWLASRGPSTKGAQ